jgi:hypothetical protein
MNTLYLRNFVEQNPKLVTCKESTRYPGLYVLKYHRKVFYDNLWTEELQEMRGLVIDGDYNIVVYPFTKIFNRHENNTDIDRDEEVTSVRKVNGFMAAVTHDLKYGFLISTTGSLDSEFVDIADKHVGHLRNEGIVPNVTFLFEICDPTDPHIIPEEAGAYLIGARDTNTGEMYAEAVLDNAAILLNVKRPEWKQCRFSDVVEEAKTCKHEGFVVHGKNLTLKIKSPYYLSQKFLARMSDKKLMERIENGSARQILDEEYYPLLDYVELNKSEFASMDEQARLEFMRNYLETQ